MKHKTNHLLYLFYRFFIALLICNAVATAQESTPEEFFVGTGVTENLKYKPLMQDNFNAIGFNTVSFRADENTPLFIDNYNLLAWNVKSELEYIYHYSSSYYSKWEAEQNQTDPERMGFKHYDYYNMGTTYGDTATWKGKKCWSTVGLTTPACSLMYGPHYRQDKKYKRWYTYSWEDTIKYVARFNMALIKDPSVQDNEDVCKIKVIFRYKEDSTHYDEEFKSRVLKVSDFNSDSSFANIYLHENPDSIWYQYRSDFITARNLDKLVDPPAGTINYIDYEAFTGIQYWVEWLRNDNKCTLYIDYVELYDNWGWNQYLENPTEVVDTIVAYASRFSDWDNIIYWGGVDEPSNIDTYTPVHIVDSLIRSDPVLAPPVGTVFNATWTDDHKVNGEDQMAQYISKVNPEKFLFEYPKSDLIRKRYLILQDLK